MTSMPGSGFSSLVGRTRRTVLSAALASGSAAALAACGASSTGGEGATNSKSAAPVTIQYWDWAAVWKDLVGQLVDAFTAKHSNVTIQWQIAPDYWPKLTASIAGDSSPDSWRMNGPNLPSWVSLGLLEDISNYVAKDKDATANLKAMAPVITDYTKRNGKQWSMPFGQAISGIIAYNEEILKAEGQPLPADQWAGGKWTWAALQETAGKLTRRDGSRHGYFVDRGSEVGWLPFLYANGGSLFTPDGKKSAINTPQAREALELMVNMSAKQLVSPTKAETTAESAEARFLSGKLTMWPQGSWMIKDLNLKARNFKWDLVPVPIAPRTSKNGSTNQMASAAMGKTSKAKDTVWEWQKFIGSKEGQDIIARAEYFPARTDSAEQIYYDAKLGPAHRGLMRDILKVTQPLPFLDIAGNTDGWGPIVNPIIDKMFAGDVSVQDGVQQMHDQLNAGIDRGFK
jgi:multiple sugar transport system substrate-binding protein